MNNGKSAQIQVTFSWVYILIAGTLILLFFVGIAFNLQKSSEKQLMNDVVQVMGSILTGAGVSEKTKNFVDTSGLVDFTLYFDCLENEYVTEFGIKDQPSRVYEPVMPVFSPREISTTKMITWSLPYKLPFKVVDFLFVTSDNTAYYLMGNDIDFMDEFVNATQGFRVKVLFTDSDYVDIDPGDNFQIRFVDFNGNSIQENAPVPEKLNLMADLKVTAVRFSGINMVDYFHKEGNVWKKVNAEPVKIISLGGERDAARYAAIFAEDDSIYQCNMGKAFSRLKYLNEVYGGKNIHLGEEGAKLKELTNFYEIEHPEKQDCVGVLKGYSKNVLATLSTHQNNVKVCLLKSGSCSDLIVSANELKSLNNQLNQNCVTLY
jgi:hypothetical protein